MRRTHFLLGIILVGCCLLVRQSVLIAQDDDNTPEPRLNILAIDDSRYPNLSLYASVIDIAARQPITSLVREDFVITVGDAETVVPIDALSTNTDTNRPQQTMLVLDLTSTVSETEYLNMRAAAIAFINTLSVDDRVGVLGMYPDTITVLQPLSIDHNAAINAMFTAAAAPVRTTDGNIVYDGLYTALENLPEPIPGIRKAVVMFTDVPDGNVGGDRTPAAVQTLAAELDTEIYILYFQTETTEALPIRERAPTDLITLAEETGGFLLESDGEQNPELASDYNDDANLEALALRVAEILAFEYRLQITSPIPSDNETYGLQLSIAPDRLNIASQQTVFRAQTGIVEIAFAPFENGARVSLPIDLQINIETASNPINQIELFRIDNNTGAEIPLSTLSTPDDIFTLTRENASSATLSLVARATDIGGNVGEAFLTLVIENPATLIPTETLTPLPTNTPLPTPTQTALPATLTPTFSIALATSTSTRIALDTTRGAPNNEDNGSDILIPVVVALMGMLGTLLIGFSLLAIAQRRNRPTPQSERPTLPRNPGLSTNAPTQNLPVATATQQPTIKMEPTPSKKIWQKAMENLDTQSVTAVDAADIPRAVLLSEDNQRYVLVEGENTIGRHSSNMVQILDATVSRYHAVIEIFGDNITIIDWQASHPSTVNGETINIGERRALRTGDQIQVGNTVLRLVSQH